MAPSGQMTAAGLDALLKDGTLTGEWAVDPRRSSIRLKSKSLLGLARVNGAFAGVSGTGTVSPAGEVIGALIVIAASIDTKNTRRDTHLRSADFFDSANYPDITFTVDHIRASDRGVRVTGALTVRDCTRPLSFDAAVPAASHDEVSLDAEVPVNRADFGLTWNKMGLVSMNNTLIVHAVFTRR